LIIWSPDGRLLAAVDTPQLVVTDTSKTSTVMVFDIATGRTMWSERVRGLVGQAVFSQDGAMLATKQGDFLFEENFVTLWDSTDGTARGELDLPAGGGGLEFLRGGDALITVGSSASDDRRRSDAVTASAQLWDVSTLEPIGEPLPIDTRGGITITRDAEGTTAIIGTVDGTAVVWDVDPERWEGLACSIAGRNLTPTEWQHYLSGRPYRPTCPQWRHGAD
jgi:WD40 repeat protein